MRRSASTRHLGTAEFASLVLALVILAVLAPPAAWAVGLARRHRGGAVLVTGLLPCSG